MKHQEGQQPYLSLRNIDRFFGITKALQGVDLDIYAGEVIGLIGPNGAGKSTMMKILTGVLPRTAGEIIYQGQPQENYSARFAKEIGINCAYQDLSLCTNLSVFENFAMLNMSHGAAPSAGWRKRAQQEAKALLERYFPGNGIDVTRPIESLSLTDRQVVEICKTLMAEDLKVLVLDEPTSALSSDKAAQLHAVVRELSEKGVAVIYISHKLDEIRIVSDRINILTNGQNNGEYFTDEITQAQLVEKMGGVSEKKERLVRDFSGEQDMVRVSGYSDDALSNISMHLKRGEIVGISGLAGSGQQELLHLIFGARNKTKPGVQISGTVAYVSGDRASEGVFPFWHIKNNILIANLDRVKGKLLIDKKKADESAQHWYDKLKFRAEGIESNIMSLSGGNQQKALIARGIASEADVILLNDPTAGVDIGTKQDIYALLDEIRSMGKSVILFSTEDAEMEICDRVYIMRDGCITGELQGEEITVPNIVTRAFVESGRQRAEEKRRGRLRQLMTTRWMLPLLTLVIIFAINVYMNPRMASYAGLRMKMSSALPLVLAAIGQMFIVMCGDVDMGNGYSIGLVNCMAAIWLTGNPLIGIGGLILFVVVYMGMAALIHLRRIPAIVVTMGMQFVWYGLALIIAPTPSGSCPAWIKSFLNLKTPLVPQPIILAVVVGVISWVLLYRCRYGIVLRGIGNNAQSVQRSGWSHMTAKVVAYMISGLLVVLAGMAYTSACNSGDANGSVNFNMMSIATVILGGCEMTGGVPVPMGVVMGAVAMNLINSLLTALKMNSNYQTAVIGLILLAVLALKYILHRKEARGRG